MSMKRNIKILATLIFIAIIIAVSTISLADNYSASIALTSDSKLKKLKTKSYEHLHPLPIFLTQT